MIKNGWIFIYQLVKGPNTKLEILIGLETQYMIIKSYWNVWDLKKEIFTITNFLIKILTTVI